MRAFKKTVLFFVCTFLLYQFCAAQTDGFSIRKISRELKTFGEKSVTPKGSFSYLGKGAQTYAFLSEDQKTVLKFYRQNRASHPLFFLRPFSSKLCQTIAKREAKRTKDLASFVLAEAHLKKETGLLGLHLTKTPEPIWITLYDKIKVKHRVDLSKFQWVLQEYATPVYTQLEEWIKQGKRELAKEQLTALIALLKARCAKGLFDKDPDLKTNFGFTNTQPIQFDIGRFALDATRKKPVVYRSDLIRITDHLRSWLNERDEELASHLEEEVARE